METGRNTIPGVLMWTPAPAQNSSGSLTDDSWEDEDEFFSQMDENGIIGLSEALKEMELEEACSKSKHKPPESINPDEADFGRCVQETSAEELNSNLSERLYHPESPRQAVLTAPTESETMNQRRVKQWTANLPEGDKYLTEVKCGKEDEKESDRRKTHELSGTLGGLGATNDLPCRVHLSNAEAAELSDSLSSVSRSASSIKSTFLPHLFHFTAEELASAPGIEAETFPDLSESLPESRCSDTSSKYSPRCPDLKHGASPQPAASFSEQFISSPFCTLNNNPREGSEQTGGHQNQSPPLPVKTRTHSSESSRTHFLTRVETDSLESKQQNQSHNRVSKIPRRIENYPAKVGVARKGTPSHQTPDFSKVEPKVNFPKDGYTPPQSKQSVTRSSVSLEPPIAFKSPADIVEEVLYNKTSRSSTPSSSIRTPTRTANFTVPPEFRSRQQASNLLQQLQENYKKLLIEHAESENTIDRLRLEAKVNLYSDPPKAQHAIHSGLNHNASKFLKLDFPQRAEINSTHMYPERHTPHQGVHPSSPQLGQQLNNVLFSQAGRFLQQLQTFEDLLKGEKLTTFEKTKGLFQLSEGLNSLEKGFLLAREEHKLLQQRGKETCSFDPERELEGLIFQCGLHMEELREQQVCDLSPSLQYISSSSSSSEEKTLTQPQSPPESFLVDPDDPAEAEMSLTNKKNDDDETDDEETLKLISKHTHVEPADHSQEIPEPPRIPSFPALQTSVEPRSEEEEQRDQRRGNSEVLNTSSQRLELRVSEEPNYSSLRRDISDHDSPVHTRTQRCSKSSLPLLLPACSRRSAMRRTPSSSLSSLADITSERRSSKGQTGSRKVSAQDGIISPETDSGFVGSESTSQTPAAASELLHQGTPKSVSHPQAVRSSPPQPASPPSPSLSPTAPEPTVSSQLNPNQPRRTRQGQRRRTFSCSHQLYISQTQQNNSGRNRELWIKTPTGSEVEQSDCYTESFDSPHSSHSGSPPAAGYRHGDSLRAPNSHQGGNHNDAVVTLQTEIAKLKKIHKNYCRNKTSLSSVSAAPSTQSSCAHHNNSSPPIRSVEIWSDESLGRRETQSVDEVDQDSATRQRTKARSSSAQRQKKLQDIWPRSEVEASTSQSRVSRFTQTSTVQHSCSSVTEHNRKTQTDEPDSRDQAHLCPHCLKSVRVKAERGTREPTQSSCCCYCSVCGGLKLHRGSETGDVLGFSDFHKQNPSTHQNCQPGESPDGAARRTCLTGPTSPSLLQFIPVNPPQLLLYSAPLYTSPDNMTDVSSGINPSEVRRGRSKPPEVRRGRARRRLSVDRHRSPSVDRHRSPSVDQHRSPFVDRHRSPSVDRHCSPSVDRHRSLSVARHRSLDRSLYRAITAAQHMKHTSRHMARSLASGLQHHKLLSQSCSYLFK